MILTRPLFRLQRTRSMLHRLTDTQRSHLSRHRQHWQEAVSLIVPLDPLKTAARRRHLPTTENLMCYGFQCGDGWFDLIWQLSEQIEAYCQQQPIAADLMAVQAKQKFGELRFYTRPKLPEMEYLIQGVRVRP